MTGIDTPDFTIVMPVFDPPIENFRSALSSLRAQTLESWELVIVDDGSTSEAVTAELDMLSKLEDRVRVMRQANKGPSAARNEGTRLARGRYVAYMDSDDELPRQTFECAREHLVGADLDLLLHFVQFVEDESMKWETYSPTASVLNEDEIVELRNRTMRGNTPAITSNGRRAVLKNGPVARFVRRNLAQTIEFPEHIRISEDTVWNLKLLDEVGTAAVSRTVGYWYWVKHESSVRGFRPHAYAETRELLRVLRSMVSSPGATIPYESYYSRVLGEINRAVLLHYARPECDLPFRQRVREINELFDFVLRPDTSGDRPPKLKLKELALRSGAAIPLQSEAIRGTVIEMVRKVGGSGGASKEVGANG